MALVSVVLDPCAVTDLAFHFDSVAAAVGVTIAFWLVMLGGLIG